MFLGVRLYLVLGIILLLPWVSQAANPKCGRILLKVLGQFEEPAKKPPIYLEYIPEGNRTQFSQRLVRVQKVLAEGAGEAWAKRLKVLATSKELSPRELQLLALHLMDSASPSWLKALKDAATEEKLNWSLSELEQLPAYVKVKLLGHNPGKAGETILRSVDRVLVDAKTILRSFSNEDRSNSRLNGLKDSVLVLIVLRSWLASDAVRSNATMLPKLVRALSNLETIRQLGRRCLRADNEGAGCPIGARGFPCDPAGVGEVPEFQSQLRARPQCRCHSWIGAFDHALQSQFEIMHKQVGVWVQQIESAR